jgi:hypothetical protein
MKTASLTRSIVFHLLVCASTLYAGYPLLRLTVFVSWWQESRESGDRLPQVWLPQIIASACDSSEL